MAPHEGHRILTASGGLPSGGSSMLFPLRSAAQSRRILSGITLTGQLENNAGVEVVVSGFRAKFDVRAEREETLKSGTTGEPSIDIVPPFELIAFAQLPTEKHDSTVSNGRKINQTTVEIFQLNSQLL